tara:strand:- start:156304 stop:156954 length:651 start_codon:yes stop_codon:yes gene_type:complete
MKLKMYHDSNCPYSRKVLILAAEHGLDDIFDFVSPFTPEGLEGITRENPLAKMPALVIKPGFAIFDSRVICRYVDTLADQSNSFYPEESSELWQALRYEALGDGMVDAAIFARQELTRPADKHMAERMKKQLGKVDEGLACLEREIDMLEASMTIGSIATSNALAYLDFRWPQIDWRDGHPRLAEWYAQIKVRPTFAEHDFVESDLLVKKLAAATQ